MKNCSNIFENRGSNDRPVVYEKKNREGACHKRLITNICKMCYNLEKIVLTTVIFMLLQYLDTFSLVC